MNRITKLILIDFMLCMAFLMFFLAVVSQAGESHRKQVLTYMPQLPQ